LYIGRLDLALDYCSRNYTRHQNAYDTIPATQSHFCQKQVIWAQLYGEGHKLYGMGVMHLDFEQDWLITGHFLDLR
jgi:hypothetical protein